MVLRNPATPPLTPEQLAHRAREVTRVLATAVPEEIELELIEGQIPPEVRGVMLRNGPGRQERGGVDYGHPFDGDGFVQRLALAEGRAWYRADWVRTDEWRIEEATDRIVFRGFGTNRPGGLTANLFDLKFKNAANTSIVTHGGRTLALWEGGVPHEIDPHSLATVGRYDFDGGLLNTRSIVDRWLNPELPFAAHPRLDTRSGDLFSFGAAYGLRPHLLVHRVSPAGELETTRVALEQLPFVHDFVLTERYCVFVLPPVSFDIPAALLGLSTPVSSLRPGQGPSTVLVWPRDGGSPRWVEGPEGFVFHWAHGFEDDAGDIVLTGMHYPTFPRLEDAAACTSVPRPVRITVPREGSRCRVEALTDHRMELPTTSTPFDAPTGTIYGVAAPPDRTIPVLSGLGRLDPDGRFAYRELFPTLPGEPVPVGDGRWLLVWVTPADGPGEVWVVDADTLETEARMRLPHAVPLALHGQWTDQSDSPRT